MLVRTDPGRGRTTFLSIPRDLRVDVPGRGFNKINAAYQFGGPDLAIRTIREFTGLKINHVVVVDFRNFERLIDALGGVKIDVKEPIVSNRFDCPYSTRERCARWRGWRFAKGEQVMGGRRALTYSRIRENQLNPAENDLTRGERQQQVVRAIADKVTSPTTLVKMPWLADDLTAPLATDLTGGQFAQLGWVKFRSGSTLRCRLGGSPSQFGGESFIVSSE
jgi:LCP family protein required for cell wall assembly